MRELLQAWATALFALGSASCNPASASNVVASDAVAPSAVASAATVDSPRARALRNHLVASLILHGDLHPGRVADAMREVPRHAFIPDAPLELAYANVALSIGFDQTISEPAVVAVMSEALELRERDRVLEIGTGSGYQAAVLGRLAHEVFTIEIIDELARRASRVLPELGYSNVHVRLGDGYLGWPERAPFDRILVTAAPSVVPQTLLEQLAEAGVLVAPVGPDPYEQRLLRYRKSKGHFRVDDLGAVAFVPMVTSSQDDAGARITR